MKLNSFLFFVLSLKLSIISAQIQSFNFKHLSTFDGLSQSSVIVFEQDKLGRMWIGTRDGLNRYDGNSFKVYRNDSTDSLSLSNNDILDIKEDNFGKIWIGTYNGLSVYDPVKDKFQNYFHNKSFNSLSHNTVLSINEISNGDLWIGTANGLSIYSRKLNKFKNYFNNPNDPKSLPGNYILSIYEDILGNVWVGTSKGLSKCLKENKLQHPKFEKIKIDAKFFESNEEVIVQDIIEGENNSLLVATKNFGLLKLNKNSDNLLPFFSIKDREFVNSDVRKIFLDKDNTLWIGTYDGLNIRYRNGILKKYTNDSNNLSSISKNSIKSLFQDKKGSIWVGTYYGGINIWDKSNNNFMNFSQNFGPNRLSYDVVSSIKIDSNKNIYIGTEGGGITVLNSFKKVVGYLNASIYKNLPSDNIKSLFVDGNDLWIGTFNAGVCVFDLNSKKFKNQVVPIELRKMLGNTGVYKIEKQQNTFWLATFGKGLLSYNLLTNKINVYNSSNNDLAQLTSNLVRSFLIDSKKNIWVGTQHGLTMILDRKVFRHFFFDDDIKSGEDILSIYEDRKNDIWVGTKAKGLFKFNGNKFIPVKILDKDKLINSINSISEDKYGILWLSTNIGIIKFNPKSKKTNIYNQKDGLISFEFNNNSVLNVDGKDFYFGGPLGLTYFNIEKIHTNTYSPQVLISDFKIRNSTTNLSEEIYSINSGKKNINSIVLSHDKANFTVSYSIPNFINPKNNLYRYRLLGLQDNWTISSQPFSNYTIQKAGDYQFEVQGANNDGIWNNKITRLLIKVNPAPWRTWWAFLIYFSLILLSLYTLSKFLKSKSELKHQLAFRHLEAERMNELNNNKIDFFTNISHEFRTPLTLILGPLQQVIEEFKGNSKIYQKLLLIEGSANHLLQLINTLMDFRKLESKSYKIEAAEGNIIKFLKEIFFSFSEFAKQGGYSYNFKTESDSVLVYYDRNKLERVFYNIISNAFRYTPNRGVINIVTKTTNKEVIISVEDTGEGIPLEYQEKIFERFFEIKSQNINVKNYNKGTGIGLSIAYDIVKLHKGKISVTSNKDGVGSIFKVSLLLGSDHLSEDEIVKDFIFSDDLIQYTNQVKEIESIINDDLNNQIDIKGKETILLVEDNQSLRYFMKDILKNKYNILEAENGRIGLEKVLKYLPDLVVSDVMMPEMVGTDLCNKIKGNLKTSHIPVILLTSRSSLIYKFEGLESGANDYISKPFNVKEFELRIKNILESNKILKNKFSNEDNIVPSEIAVSDIDQKLLKKAIDIVNDNLSNETFDIPFFASELGVSRTVLFTKIKAWTNFTPNEFITEIRMKKAAELLERKSMNISQISYKVGFKNPKYFSKCFQKKYGLTPSQYVDKFYTDF